MPNELLQLAQEQDINKIRATLKDKPGIHLVTGRYGYKLLHYVAQEDNEAFLKELLKKEGLDLNERTNNKRKTVNQANNGLSPLQVAASNGSLNVMKILLDQKGINVNVDTTSDYSGSLLGLAFKNMKGKKPEKEQAIVKKLLELNAYSIESSWFQNALFCAVQKEDLAIFEILLDTAREKEINLKERDRSLGKTLLHRMPLNLTAIKMLLNKGKVDVDAVTHERETHKGETKLYSVVSLITHNNPETVLAVVKELLEHGAKPDKPSGSRGETPFHRVARSGNEEIFSELLKKIPEGGVNSIKDEDGLAVLHYAAMGNNPKITKKLLTEEKADVDIVSNRGETPLFLAVEYSNNFNRKLEQTTIDLLLSHKADPNKANFQGITPLHKAVRKNIDLVKLPFDALLARDNHAHEIGSYEWRPLHYAAHCFHVEGITSLLDQEVEVDAATQEGETALYFAIKAINNENLESGVVIVNKLLAGGADPTKKNNEGIAPLELAIRKDCKSVVNLLFESLLTKAQLQEMGMKDVNGWEILHYAAYCLKIETIKTLLDQGADVNAITSKGETPLLLAIKRIAPKNLKLVEDIANELLKREADPNLKDHEGIIPLHLVAKKGSEGLFRSLLAKAQDKEFNIKKGGWTCLHFVAYRQDPAMLQLLLEQEGVDINAVTNSGATAFYLATTKDAEDDFEGDCDEYSLDLASPLIKELLKAGADPNRVHNNGETPLHNACYSMDDDAVELLLSYGANPNLKGRNNGMTLLQDLAFEDKAFGFVSKLIKKGADIGNRKAQYDLLRACFDATSTEGFKVYVADFLMAGLDASACIQVIKDEGLKEALKAMDDKRAECIQREFNVERSKIPNTLRALPIAVKIFEKVKQGASLEDALKELWGDTTGSEIDIMRSILDDSENGRFSDRLGGDLEDILFCYACLKENPEKWVKFNEERFSSEYITKLTSDAYDVHVTVRPSF